MTICSPIILVQGLAGLRVPQQWQKMLSHVVRVGHRHTVGLSDFSVEELQWLGYSRWRNEVNCVRACKHATSRLVHTKRTSSMYQLAQSGQTKFWTKHIFSEQHRDHAAAGEYSSCDRWGCQTFQRKNSNALGYSRWRSEVNCVRACMHTTTELACPHKTHVINVPARTVRSDKVLDKTYLF